MDDIVERVDRFLENLPPPKKPVDTEYLGETMLSSMTMLVDAIDEIERLREALGKISMLGQNAAPGSFLEECGVIASSALMRPM
jgi:hypothetical protein